MKPAAIRNIRETYERHNSDEFTEKLEQFSLKDSKSQNASLPASNNLIAPSKRFVTTSLSPLSLPIYMSAERREALRECGWFDIFQIKNNSHNLTNNAIENAEVELPSATNIEMINFETMLENLEANGNWERSAALSIFHLQFRRALKSLTMGAEQRLKSRMQFNDIAKSPFSNPINNHRIDKENRGVNPESASQSSLNSDALPDLALVAMALSGYAAFIAQQQMQASSNDTHSILLPSDFQTFFKIFSQNHINPYIRAIFHFLSSLRHASTSSSFSFMDVVEESGLDLRDRIAFSCRFMNDVQLSSYLEICSRRCLRRGILDGLILTGLSLEGCFYHLLQAYVDRTSDIQTVACLSAYSECIHLYGSNATIVREESQLSQWLRAYRALLNQWQLWFNRAQFDVSHSVLNSTITNIIVSSSTPHPTSSLVPSSSFVTKTKTMRSILIPPQVSARCTYCGQSLSLEGLSSSKGESRQTTFNPRSRNIRNALRDRICPNCRKSLPRCALCLVGMEAAMPQLNKKRPTFQSQFASTLQNDSHHNRSSSTNNNDPNNLTNSTNKPSLQISTTDIQSNLDCKTPHNFDYWFTWCQLCRHGGHAAHLLDWFRTHDECPVSDCECRCRQHDSTFV